MTKPIKLALLIDDEVIDQRMYTRILMRSGLMEELKCFELAIDALEYLKSDAAPKVDVIFLDINMPLMDGFEFLEAAQVALGPDYAKMVVAMLTTSLNPADEARARSFEVVRKYIVKPLKLHHVAEVAELLKKGGSAVIPDH